MQHDGKEWKYLGGKSGLSEIRTSKLSLSELKRHLADHISVPDEILEKTNLSWKLVHNAESFMCALDGNETVQNMVKHVTRATAGYVEKCMPGCH
jgi:hypothetical protein